MDRLARSLEEPTDLVRLKPTTKHFAIPFTLPSTKLPLYIELIRY